MLPGSSLFIVGLFVMQEIGQAENHIGKLKKFAARIEKIGAANRKQRVIAVLADEFSEYEDSPLFLTKLASVIELCGTCMKLVENSTFLDDELKADATGAIQQIANTIAVAGINRPWDESSTAFDKFARTRLAWAENALLREHREEGEKLRIEDNSGALLLEGAEDQWEPLPIERESPEFEDAIGAVEKVVEEVAGNNGYAQTEPEERDRVLWSLRTGLDMVRNHWPTKSQVNSLLITPIKYLVKKFSDTAIGLAAKEGLAKLMALLGSWI